MHRLTFASAALLMLCECASAAAPQVTNVRASQRPGTKLIDVYYDLADADSASVYVAIQVFDETSTSYSQGTPLPVLAVTGHVGVGVTPGTNRLITWNAGQDWNRRYTLKGKARIIADDLSTTPPAAGLVYVPAGFGKPDGSNYEIFTSGFFMDRTEVSSQLWNEVYSWAIANGYSFDNIGVATNSTHPTTGINWYDAVKWCNARSEKEGLSPCYYTNNTLGNVYRSGQIALNNDSVNWGANGYRLPTRAEWIKAYWGGNTAGFFPWPSFGGSKENHYNGSMGNYYASGDPFEPGTTPVGYYNGSQTPAGPDTANGFGLYDMFGNVGEWCWDRSFGGWYGLDESRDDNSRGPTGGLGTTRCFSGVSVNPSSYQYNKERSQPYVEIANRYFFPSSSYGNGSTSNGDRYDTAVGLRAVRGL